VINKVELSRIISNSVGKDIYDDRYSNFGDYSFNEWATIHEQVVKNIDFLNDNKIEYIHEFLFLKAKNNLDKIIKVGFPLTKYIVKRQSDIYSATTYIRTDIKDASKSVDELALKKALIAVAKSFYLNKAGAIYIDYRKHSEKVSFKSINMKDIIYNLNTDETLYLTKELGGYNIFEYSIDKKKALDYYKDLYVIYDSDDIISIIEFLESNKTDTIKMRIIAKDFQQAYQLIQLKMLGELPDDLNKYIKELKTPNISKIFFIFENIYTVPQINSICDNDAMISVLYSFGLMGVPQELLTKFILTRGENITAKQSDKKIVAKELSELLAILYLNNGEELKQFETGGVQSMLNLVTYFDKLYNQICKFNGIPAPFGDSKSGGGTIANEKVSSSFNDTDKILFDELENKIFASIEEVLGKKFGFLNYRKGYFHLSTSSEVLNEEILKGANGLTTPVDSLMRINSLPEKKALKLYKDIEKFRKEHDTLYSGLVGMGMQPEATKGQTMYPDKDSEKGNQGNIND